MIGLVVAGFVALAFGWRGTARAAYVPLQVPELVSGGVGGLALIGVGLALFDVQTARRDAAREQRLIDEALDHLAALAMVGPKVRERAERNRPASR
jgi:hypothetical protein